MHHRHHLLPPLTAAAAAIAFTFVAPHAADAQVAVTINGSAVDVQPAPIVQAGRVFVPLRGVFEQLGASVVYDNGQINASGNGRNISLHIGSTGATVDGQPQTIDVAPFIVGASTYVPLRFISESLGASVNWDDGTDTVAIALNGGGYAPPSDNGSQSEDDISDYADQAPPPIPDYDQPPAPQDDEIWQPGYWQNGQNGYYWVPGTWVEPPQTGYLWTPGYWQARNNGYAWNAGYWALAVGFYGGVNYGAGYFGNGYTGGRWNNNHFEYNTYVTHVDTANVHNVYDDRNVTINNTTNRISYNGGPHGIAARPTAEDATVAHERHIGMTPAQRQHVQTAASDRRFLATVNHDQPPVLAVARPLSTENRPSGYEPVTPGDRVAPARPPAAARPAAPAPADRAPAYHAPAAAPAYHAPAAAPAERPAAPRPAAPRPAEPAYHAPAAAPAERPAAPRPAAPRPAEPAYHAPAAAPPAPARPAAAPPAPARPAAPAYHAPAAPPQREAPPAYHAPAAQVAPQQHAPPPQRPAVEPHAAPPQPGASDRKDDHPDHGDHG